MEVNRKSGMMLVVLMTLALGLMACGKSIQSSPTATTTSTPGKTPPPSATITPDPTDTATPTDTPTPTITPTPTDTATPTVTSTPTQTPIPQSAQVISVDNASQVTVLSSWGRGRIYMSEAAADGQVIVASTSMGLYLYQADNMQVIRQIPEVLPQQGWGAGFLFSPDRQMLLANYGDSSVHLINLRDGKEIAFFPPIIELKYNIIDWLLTLPKEEYDANYQQYFYEANKAISTAYTPDGETIAICYNDGTIGLWSLADGQLIRKLTDIARLSERMIFSPDGKWLAASMGSDIGVWDVEQGKLLWKLPKAGHFNGQPFSADGSLIAAEITSMTSLDAWVTVHSAQFGDVIGKVVGRVASNPISPDNKLLVTTWYNDVKIWSLPYLVQQEKIDTGLDWPQASFSADGQYILINGGEQAWKVSDFSQDVSYPAPSQPTPAVDIPASIWGSLGHLVPEGIMVISPERVIAWGKEDSTHIWWWDVFSGGYHSLTVPVMGRNHNAELSPDGTFMAACTEEGLAIAPLDGSEPTVFKGCRAPGSLAISGDGKEIFVASSAQIDVIDVSTGQLLSSFIGHTRRIADIKLSADKRFLVSATDKGSGGYELILWQVDPADRLGTWTVPENWTSLGTVVITDGGNLMVANLSNRLRAYRISDGEQVKIFDMGSNGVAVSPDNQVIVLGASIWQISDLTQLVTFEDHTEAITGAVFMPDGNAWLTISDDGLVRLWGIP